MFRNVIKRVYRAVSFSVSLSSVPLFPFLSFSLICVTQACDPGMGLGNAGWRRSWVCRVQGRGRGPVTVAPLLLCPHLCPGSCTQLTSAVWQSTMSQKCFENSQGIFWVSRTCSKVLDLNDQKQGFAGHTFPHMKGRIHASLDTLVFHPVCPKHQQDGSGSI